MSPRAFELVGRATIAALAIYGTAIVVMATPKAIVVIDGLLRGDQG